MPNVLRTWTCCVRTSLCGPLRFLLQATRTLSWHRWPAQKLNPWSRRTATMSLQLQLLVWPHYALPAGAGAAVPLPLHQLHPPRLRPTASRTVSGTAPRLVALNQGMACVLRQNHRRSKNFAFVEIARAMSRSSRSLRTVTAIMLCNSSSPSASRASRNDESSF